MRWFTIRSAKIDPKLRETFEQHGMGTMQQFLVNQNMTFWHHGQWSTAANVRADFLAWLTERYDVDDLKETWNLTMEAAIVVLILVELALILLDKK